MEDSEGNGCSSHVYLDKVKGKTINLKYLKKSLFIGWLALKMTKKVHFDS